MKLILLGPPGSGKGTVAVHIEQAANIPHISTGALFRDSIERRTELGLKVKEFLSSGELVPDSLTIAMVEERLKESDAANGFILDGFPRTVPQAEALSKISPITHVLNLVSPDDLLIKRLAGRRSCPACGRTYNVYFMPPRKEDLCDDDNTALTKRSDDSPDSVKNRLVVYQTSTSPLIDWYKNKELLFDVDSSVSPEHTFAAVRGILNI